MKFSLGRLVSTPGALHAFVHAGDSPMAFLNRHMNGDWGDVDSEDKKANDHACLNRMRILSSYKTSKGEKVWIITEADRSATTILLPAEY
jgi:hypothetical protein